MVRHTGLKNPGVYTRGGSSPFARTIKQDLKMRYAIIPHVLSVIMMIFTYRWLNGMFPVIYDYRTYIIPVIALLWFMAIYKGIQFLGNRLDNLDDQIVANQTKRTKK